MHSILYIIDQALTHLTAQNLIKLFYSGLWKYVKFLSVFGAAIFFIFMDDTTYETISTQCANNILSGIG